MRLPLILLAIAALGAGLAAAGNDYVTVKGDAGYNYYSANDGVQVQSPQFSMETTLDQRSSLTLEYGLDAVSAASFDYARSKTHHNDAHSPGQCYDCHSTVDALSGATHSYIENRQFVTVGAQRRIGDTKAKVSWYHSGENDYRSEAVHVSLDQDLADRDATLSVDLGHQADQLGSTINKAFSRERYSNQVSVALTQLLDAHSQIRGVLDYQGTQGYLADPYAFVFIRGEEDTPLRASAPDKRDRWDVGLTYKLAFDWKASMEAGWRYYQDSWQVSANSLSLSYAHQFDQWVLQPEYRFYNQSQASFFRNDYDQYQPYMTRDLKLAAFSTHWLGVDLRGPLTELFGAELRYGRYVRYDSLDYSHYFADAPAAADTWQISVNLR